MRNKPFRHYIPYIVGGILGLFLRTAYFGFHGRSCTMDGHDILNAALFIIMVWCLKGLFARDNTTKRECVPKRPLAITSEGNGVCPCCENLVTTSDKQCQWCGQPLDWGE